MLIELHLAPPLLIPPAPPLPPLLLQAPPTDFSRPVSLGSGLFVCGDHRDSATLDGAIKSGRRAAEAVLGSA